MPKITVKSLICGVSCLHTSTFFVTPVFVSPEQSLNDREKMEKKLWARGEQWKVPHDAKEKVKYTSIAVEIFGNSIESRYADDVYRKSMANQISYRECLSTSALFLACFFPRRTTSTQTHTRHVTQCAHTRALGWIKIQPEFLWTILWSLCASNSYSCDSFSTLIFIACEALSLCT